MADKFEPVHAGHVEVADHQVRHLGPGVDQVQGLAFARGRVDLGDAENP